MERERNGTERGTVQERKKYSIYITDFDHLTKNEDDYFTINIVFIFDSLKKNPKKCQAK